jgi:hypothetical protein
MAVLGSQCRHRSFVILHLALVANLAAIIERSDHRIPHLAEGSELVLTNRDAAADDDKHLAAILILLEEGLTGRLKQESATLKDANTHTLREALEKTQIEQHPIDLEVVTLINGFLDLLGDEL